MGLFSCNDRDDEGTGVKQKHPGRIHAIISMIIGTIILNLKRIWRDRSLITREEEYGGMQVIATIQHATGKFNNLERKRR